MRTGLHILCLILLTASCFRAAAAEQEAIAAEDVMKLLSSGTPVAAETPDGPADSAKPENDMKPAAEPARSESTNDTAVAYTGPRDPFWPVGYAPKPKEDLVKKETEIIPRQKEEWPALTVRGIIRQGREKYMAVLNGVGLVEVGELVSIEKGGLVYQWRIESITGTDVSCTRLEARQTKNLAGKEDAQ